MPQQKVTPTSRRYAAATLTAAIFLLLLSSLPATATGQELSLAQTKTPIVEMLRLPGKLVARGSNTRRTGRLRLQTYSIEEIELPVTEQVELQGQKVETRRAWRVTVTGGPFHVRALPAVIWIDGVPLGIAQESERINRLTVITFDESALREGATISVGYGVSSDGRVELPEKLSFNIAR
jgi:hypothetical protein